jgi:hypothetical protein
MQDWAIALIVILLFAVIVTVAYLASNTLKHMGDNATQISENVKKPPEKSGGVPNTFTDGLKGFQPSESRMGKYSQLPSATF